MKKVAPQFGFGITEISTEEIDEVNISSTPKLEQPFKKGDIETANTYLGSPLFSIKGEVVE
ncbi:MAG: hypothetical protein R2779_05975 [Crocinitomicaceae bacterium]